MPIYEYHCTACGNQLEVIQKMSDEPLTECPECHKPALAKLVSAAGFQLKGTGWYATDYSAKAKAKSANEKENTSGTENKSSEPKTQDSSDTQKSSTDSGAST